MSAVILDSFLPENDHKTDTTADDPEAWRTVILAAMEAERERVGLEVC